MKLEIQKSILQKALAIVQKGVTPRINPILTYLKLEIRNKRLDLTYSSDSLSLITTVDQESVIASEDGGVLIDAKTLNDILRVLTEPVIKIEVFENTTTLIFDGVSEYKLPTVDVNEYPELDFDPKGEVILLKSDVFVDLVEQTSFAAATNDKRPLFTALNLNLEDGLLTAIAAEATRIAKKAVKVSSAAHFNINPEAKHISEIVKILEGTKELKLSTDGKVLLIEVGKTKIRIKLLSGDYPTAQIARIIKLSTAISVEFETEVVMQRISSVTALNDAQESRVRMLLKKGVVEFSSKNNQGGTSLSKILGVDYDGDQFDIYFNSIHTLQSIKGLKSKYVTFNFSGELKPFSLTNKSDPEVIQVLTPIRAV
ncbi:MAG: DNA polymerase III subunit beta [Erysipelotrichaceae bacterium]|nr:DNA polymerase III subunit beta [Erysipelotrichaceae bacterium]